MQWQFHPYVLLTFLAAGIALVAAYYSWRRRSAPGAACLALALLMIVVVSGGMALEIGGRTQSLMVMAHKIQDLGLCLFPLLWLRFVLGYTGHRRYLTPRVFSVFIIIPLLAAIMILTFEHHQWFYQEIWVNTETDPILLAWKPAWGYWLLMIYVYGLMGVGIWMLVRKFIHLPRLYEGQTVLIIIAGGVPSVIGVFYVMGVFPRNLPLGIVGLSVSGAALSWGLFRYRLLDIAPVAYEAVFEGMSDAIIVLDMRRQIVDLNPAAQRLIGKRTDEVIGEEGASAFAFLPDLLRVCDGDAPSYIKIILNEEESEHSYDVGCSVLYDRRHRLTGYLIVLRDITALEAARRAAQAADRAKSEFVSSVSHELRTPLTNIKLYLNLLERGAAARRPAYLQTIQREVARLQGLIEDLLHVSRVDLGKIQPEIEWVDLNALVRTLADDRRMLFAKNDLDLRLELDSDLAPVRADPKLLEQVVTNLLSNALNYTPEGYVMLRTAQARVDGAPWATVAVIDTGLGIAPAEQDKLFERFYRGAASQTMRVPGTGLGLAISQGIMALHRGQITCESIFGAGSTFTLWLPMRETTT
ncbi:MAG: histidine kinase N-terminal 7TM domain-containing protein [Anaerolineales bacterium]